MMETFSDQLLSLHIFGMGYVIKSIPGYHFLMLPHHHPKGKEFGPRLWSHLRIPTLLVHLNYVWSNLYFKAARTQAFHSQSVRNLITQDETIKFPGMATSEGCYLSIDLTCTYCTVKPKVIHTVPMSIWAIFL